MATITPGGAGRLISALQAALNDRRRGGAQRVNAIGGLTDRFDSMTQQLNRNQQLGAHRDLRRDESEARRSDQGTRDAAAQSRWQTGFDADEEFAVVESFAGVV